MERKTVTIVGIFFNKEEVQDILDYLHEYNIFSKDDEKEFSQRLNKGEEISLIYQEIMNSKKN